MKMKRWTRVSWVRSVLVREPAPREYGVRLDGPQAVAKVLQQIIGNKDREHFVVLLLNARWDVIGINTVAIGCLQSAVVQPREVFSPAFLGGVSGIVLGHNHPSQDVSPSVEDIQLTRRLVEVGELIGIQVLDHVIVSETAFVSLRELGHIK
jgi:DNA repair protein RadC